MLTLRHERGCSPKFAQTFKSALDSRRTFGRSPFHCRARLNQQPRDCDVIRARKRAMTPLHSPYERRCRKHAVERVDRRPMGKQNTHRFRVTCHRRAM